MIPHESFLRELAILSTELSVRWVPWAEGIGPDETVSVWPVRGRPFEADPRSLPQTGRFVIFERNSRTGMHERVFDVVYPDGSFMPLDHRSIAGLGIRRWWGQMEAKALAKLAEETADKERADKRKDFKAEMERDGRFHESLEKLYEEEAGLHSYALGAPGSATPPRMGGLSGVEFEKVSPPPRKPEPPADITLIYD